METDTLLTIFSGWGRGSRDWRGHIDWQEINRGKILAIKPMVSSTYPAKGFVLRPTTLNNGG
jgi:hypothetical protein